MAETIRVVILEDHPSIVDGYQFRLGRAKDIKIVAALSFGEELESALIARKPVHLLILDINVPTSSTNSNPYPILQLMPKLLDIYPDLQILVISMHKQRALIKAVVQAGASGYILKDDRETIENLGSVVRMVARGGIHFSKEAHQQILRQPTDTLPLTPRQYGVGDQEKKGQPGDDLFDLFNDNFTCRSIHLALRGQGGRLGRGWLLSEE